ncbi:2-deoxy-scyllo-inosose synthase [Kitasatospora aureofaciens]|uniref:2-deoxy-scyllo-inosose synthase n=1 Tax=Kitasatospora aureofaciens TaxID=1894 RepID=UPI001C4859CA|nr:2-deoxy-scyllo-inosose synthase [Kitasatospora aureofaciens]MBV6702043.1 iron-containing alcohol dehydrogenase [Kitasatospora aureofaciens]
MSDGSIIELSSGTSPACPFYLGDSIGDRLPEYLGRYDFDEFYLVTSESLYEMFGRDLASRLCRAGIAVNLITVAEGEAAKGWPQLTALCERLVASGATKDSIVGALGGGMISNLAGLAAAMVYRGLRFVEIPTTMLNLTDGTLSNKQAINGALGKNQFGVYHAPLFIWADVAMLRGEPVRQHRSALVEALKNGLVNDAAWVDRLEFLLADGVARIRDNLLGLCHEVVRSKLEILALDPGERQAGIILEYGHTVGHAVEFLSGGALLHGEAVGIGMCAAARVGVRLGITAPEVLERQEHVLGTLMGGPTTVPAEFSPERIVEVILSDNKRRSGSAVRFVLVPEIGRVHLVDGDHETPVPEPLLKSVLADA